MFFQCSLHILLEAGSAATHSSGIQKDSSKKPSCLQQFTKSISQSMTSFSPRSPGELSPIKFHIV